MNAMTRPASISPIFLLLRRILALAYDALVLTGLVMILTFPYLGGVYWLTGSESIPAGSFGYQAYLALIIVVYFMASWHWGGQTIGMRAWRLFATYNGQAGLPWAACLRRAPAGVVGLLLAGLGYWWSLIDANGRTWADIASGAITEYRKKPAKPR